MSREIKFRVWDLTKKMMFETPIIRFELCNEYSGTFGIGNLFNHKHTKLMQFTGLKDKNGVEIYEGDIVQFIAPEGENWKAEVEWDEGAFCFNINDYVSACSWWPNITESGNLEVIGNIHENGDLLS